MKNTATKVRTEATNNSVRRIKIASNAFAANTQHKSILKPQHRFLRQYQSLVALYAKASTGCGNAVSLRSRPPIREPRSWLRQSSVSLVCVIDICSGSEKVLVNVEKMVATSSHNNLLQGAERVFPAKPSTNNNINTSKSNAGTSRPTTGQQQSSRTTTLSCVTDVKGLHQIMDPRRLGKRLLNYSP